MKQIETLRMLESVLLARVEAQCGRALAGDHDRKSLTAALTFAIDGVQEVRAALRAMVLHPTGGREE